MFTPELIDTARARVACVTGISLPFPVDVSRGEGLSVTLRDGAARIEADGVNSLSRGFFLLSRCVREGRTACDIRQHRAIASCGAMADVSRNAVLKPDAVRRLIDRLAALGMNLLLLYTEDTFEVPGYPYLGHLRGRYSLDDLRAFDDYAAAAGIELVPCIQTLGHMEQFLQWQHNHPLRDQPDILLIDDDEVYRFIEAEIAAMRSCVRSRRIHIGMDEAHGVGFGQYHLMHGDVNRFELLSRHLSRVLDICGRHDFIPMMWSDMFFRLGSRQNDYYDEHAVIPQDVIDHMPHVDLCYWDYYHQDEAFYDRMLREHRRMGREIVFAGGNWVWAGFLPHVKKTEATMLPALRACIGHGVQTVFCALWGDDGAETNLFLAANRLPLFSEFCWQGADCPMEEIERAGECLTGLPDPAFRAMGEFFPDESDLCTGKQLIWCDLLLPLTYETGDPPDAVIRRCTAARGMLTRYEGREDCRYAALLFDIVLTKAPVIRDLRSRYLAGDRAYLAFVAGKIIPGLIGLYEQLERAHRALWERDMKRLGWEVLCLRYGAVRARLLDVQDEISRYLVGSLERIEALDEQPLPVGGDRLFYRQLVSSSVHV